MKPWFFHSPYQEPATAAAPNAPSKFQIRAATPADLTGVAQIIAESFHSKNGLLGWLFPILRLGIYEDLRHRLASSAPHHLCLVAANTTNLRADDLVATVEMGVRFNDSWTEVSRSVLYLSNLAVHPTYRRQGAASSLLLACEQVALNWGFQDLYLHVLENNHEARHLYLKLGYRVYKVESCLNAFFLRRSRQILLHKRLTSDQ
ncbi:GCN5 family acetyltransferase [Scytonema hofmannii PCC 7110]|uniref:GCN5 family acetyltransferase n=1 Tax=Scytonema hofmannii PCC 7110 TaxID=128403 RepID=A0A139X631_9CYAN|nr:GNAT family N-acetyltransferase [Scytonema hofmannii]KYC40158.1 GCN5 family acetyltransferase [Scytonema hofmannii PCC 7110]